jgi:hypothetical protein
MGLKSLVSLPDDVEKRCRVWAERVVTLQLMKNAVSCFGAENNIELQAQAKMGECAFAIWAGADPVYALHWEDRPDPGHDFVWRGKRWDVKHALTGRKFLIWPVTKKSIYEQKQFDAIVLVLGNAPAFEIAGWISKEAFRYERETASEGHRLHPGTWFLPKDRLWNIEAFRNG